MNISRHTAFTWLAACCALGVAACADSDPAPSPPSLATRFEVTITNLTAGQPLSPPALIPHGNGYQIFETGQPASLGLETLAEGGDGSLLINEAQANPAVPATTSGTAPIGPGASQTLMLEQPVTSSPGAAMLSAATMLVNTNDAFAAGLLDLASLAVGEERSARLGSYDAGTEANDELAAHIPRPAGGGAGFAAARDDLIDAVLPPRGSISRNDGLATSALTSVHRWLDPVVSIQV
ncbi:MAG: spondin domain-containing protein [Burkholderiaceae bacterium]